MKQLQFNDYEEFVCDISDTFNNIDDEYGEVSIIAKYNEAKEIIKELLCIGYDIASVELDKEEFENYYDEYIIGLNSDGVWCEKFKRDTGYSTDESTVIYIMDNCSSKVIPHCKANTVYEVKIGADLCDTDADKDIDSDIHGFTLSKNDENGYCSLSYHTTNPLTEEDIHNILREFGFTLSK